MIAIRVQGLGKRYKVVRTRTNSLRERIGELGVESVRALGRLLLRRGSTPPETVWAVRDVSFDVERGEVLGLLGRNGAGKSTLLKLLARITRPTEGRAEMHGRLGALLEVGTGFHSELTGRENVYLSGAILGMRRAEIARRFDEIVAFAEVDRFIDTPVKRYSSGMVLRLAFAVAAHLEAEILLVDEALSVGDAEFQRKCLGKMGDVARAGRTVIYVSHHLATVQSLCTSAIVLRDGRISFRGTPADAISHYLARDGALLDDLTKVRERGGSGPLRFSRLCLRNHLDQVTEIVACGHELRLDLSYAPASAIDFSASDQPSSGLRPRVEVYACRPTGERLFLCSTTLVSGPERLPEAACVRLTIERLPLVPGRYTLELALSSDRQVLDHIWDAKPITVTEGDFFGTGRLPGGAQGVTLVPHSWELRPYIDDPTATAAPIVPHSTG